MKILVIAEHDNTQLKNNTLNTLSAAMDLLKDKNSSIDVLIAGFNCQAVAEKIASAEKVNQVLLADDKAYEHHTAENIADLVASLGENYECIMAPASTFGKNFLPRVAALLDVEQISEVCKIQQDEQGRILFVHPIYAGNALETVLVKAPIIVITVRISAFNAFKLSELSNKKAEIRKIDSRPDLKLSTYLGLEAVISERPDLSQASTIVSGGRGFQSSEKFKLIETLADKLQAAIGASRAAVDAGFAPNDYQVGQTGKVVAPDLYIAIGISGAIQHLAGMKDSKVIVAINKDPEAPIFKIATYGLVGDLFTIIPDLLAELDKTV